MSKLSEIVMNVQTMIVNGVPDWMIADQLGISQELVHRAVELIDEYNYNEDMTAIYGE